MVTQSEVLQIVNRDGFYTARLYEFNRCVRGISDVSPAVKLTEKGVLILKEKSEQVFEEGTVTHYTWVKV